ncbi:Aspartate aminotransferase 3 [Hibiscus syriacus]|uniref:Aspartate aminotransferase 3 n=1 Tax=Hibiscus syriacus TaxID=106335 RepID=A0A6A2WY35_HIBSY|nr:Aspartate aminotransferase 3 [Hibiscus syriacus]
MNGEGTITIPSAGRSTGDGARRIRVLNGWHNHLNPAINKEAWTQEEELTLIRAHQVFGKRWAKLTKFLPGSCSQSTSDSANASVDTSEISGVSEENNSHPLQRSEVYCPSLEVVNFSIPEIPVEAGYSRSGDYQLGLPNLPNVSSMELGQESSRFPDAPKSLINTVTTSDKQEHMLIMDDECCRVLFSEAVNDGCFVTEDFTRVYNMVESGSCTHASPSQASDIKNLKMEELTRNLIVLQVLKRCQPHAVNLLCLLHFSWLRMVQFYMAESPLMMSPMNCISPFRLPDSPLWDDSPDAALKNAAKTFTGTPSILKKRHRDLLSPLSERCDKKLQTEMTSNLTKEFYHMDDESGIGNASQESPSE